MKTNELSGGELDLWVSRAENRKPDMLYMPSTDWAHGGPILARMIESGEFCVWEYDGVITVSNRDPECTPNKRLENGELDWEGESVLGEGSTLLLAAMRAFVTSKFGEEVKD